MLFSIYDAWHNIAALSRWRIGLLASPTHWIFGGAAAWHWTCAWSRSVLLEGYVYLLVNGLFDFIDAR